MNRLLLAAALGILATTPSASAEDIKDATDWRPLDPTDTESEDIR